MIYNSLTTYFAETGDDLVARITRMKAVRAAMEDALLTGAGMGDIQQYTLNDGQTIINATQRDPKEIMKTITGLDYLISRLETQINGRVTSTVNNKMLMGRWNYGN